MFLGSYFGATIVLLAISTALTVVVLNIHHRGTFGNKVPKWLRTIVLDWLALPMLLKDKVEHNVSILDEHLASEQVRFKDKWQRPLEDY